MQSKWPQLMEMQKSVKPENKYIYNFVFNPFFIFFWSRSDLTKIPLLQTHEYIVGLFLRITTMTTKENLGSLYEGLL